jgi:hypothetical protein
MYWMPETGNHALAEKLHKQLEAEGLVTSFGSGNKAGDITYTYSDGKNKAYLLARRNGFHEIKRKYAEAHGKGSMQDVQPVGTKYSPSAVQKEINKDKRIGGKEAKTIHALLKGRTGDEWTEKKAICKGCGAKTGIIESAVHKPFYRDHWAAGTKKRCPMSLKPVDGTSGKYKKATDETFRVFDSGEVIDVSNEVKPVGDAIYTRKELEGMWRTDLFKLLKRPAKEFSGVPTSAIINEILGEKKAKDSANKALAPIAKVIPRSKRPKAEDAELTMDQYRLLKKMYQREDSNEKIAKAVGIPVSQVPSAIAAAKKVNTLAKDADPKAKRVYETAKQDLAEAQRDGSSHEFVRMLTEKVERLRKEAATDASPFDIDTDAGAAKIVKREAKTGLSAKQIVKKYGFSLSFVEEEMPGAVKRV